MWEREEENHKDFPRYFFGLQNVHAKQAPGASPKSVLQDSRTAYKTTQPKAWRETGMQGTKKRRWAAKRAKTRSILHTIRQNANKAVLRLCYCLTVQVIQTTIKTRQNQNKAWNAPYKTKRKINAQAEKGANGARHVLKLCCKTYFFCSSEKHYVVPLHRVITASEQSSVRVRTRATKNYFPAEKSDRWQRCWQGW